MSWLAFALISLITFVFYDVISRFLATKSDNPRVFSAIYNIFVALMSPVIFLLDPSLPIHLNLTTILLTIIGIIVWGLLARVEFYAHAHVDASTLAIILKLAPILNFVMAIFILQESVTSNKLIGMVLIILANAMLLLGSTRRNLISDKGLKYALLVSALLATAWLLDAINVNSWGIATYAVMSYFGGAIICGLFPRITLTQIKKEFSLVPIWQIAILSGVNLAGYSSMLKALSLGPASQVMPIITSTTPFVVLLSVFVLGERKHLLRKFLASLLAVLAIYLIR